VVVFRLVRGDRALAAVAGRFGGGKPDPVAAVDRHRQVFLAEGDHTAAEPADRPLAPHPLLELQADEDAQPQNKLADLRVGVRIARERCDAVDRRDLPPSTAPKVKLGFRLPTDQPFAVAEA